MAKHAVIETISVADYLAGEEIAEVRHEYVAGQVFAMVGATRGHNLVAGNVFAFLRRHLRGSPCSTYMSDMKVRIEAADAFYYPDVMVSCEVLPLDAVYLEQPILIVEVLSPSTENIDRREKWLNYQKLSSLREYVLVSPDALQVEVYRQGDGFTGLDCYDATDEAVTLTSVDARMPLAEIYAGVLA
ncbi:MAG TPA: Uma2 family endonuclease [Methylothermaceae bacterium]|nr:Uma2 family endonuclease [Methylothermaceae bacterium]